MKKLNFVSAPFSLLLAIAFNVSSLEAQLVSEWTTVFVKPPDPTLEVPTFVDDRGPGNYLIGTQATAMVTWNSGKDWREVFSLPSKTVVYADQVLDGAFVDEGHYLLVIRNRIYRSLGQGSFSWIDKYRMLISTDGGQEWDSVDLPETPHMTLSMLNNREGLVAIEEEESGALYSTTDGGVTWSREVMPENVRFLKVLMVEPSVWAGTGYNREDSTFRFYRTTDRGRTWDVSLEEVRYMQGCAAVDGHVVFCAGQKFNGSGNPSSYIIRKSTDGGMTWRTVLDTARRYAQLLYSVDFADSLNGIAVGNRSSVWRTTDGGESWSEEPPSDELGRYGEFLLDVAYPAVNDAMVVSSRTGVMAYRGRQTLAPPVILRPDSNLTDHPVSTTIIWSSIEGASAYDVEIGDTAYTFDEASNTVFDDPWLDTTDVTDTSLTVLLMPRTRYAIRVRAVSESLTGLWSQVLRLESEGEGKTLTVPRFIYPENGQQNVPVTARFLWSEVPGAVGYDLKIRQTIRYPAYHYVFNHIPNTFQTVEEMGADTTYYAALRARDADGVTSAWIEISYSTGGLSSVPEGTRESTSLSALSLHSNVITDRLTLSLPVAPQREVLLRLISVDGREAMRRSLASNYGSWHHDIDCSTLQPGHYLLAIEVGQERRVVSVVVLR